MNEFDRRWQVGAREARKRPDDRPVELPPGFVTRVIATVNTRGEEASSWAILQWLCQRALAVLCVLLLVALALARPLRAEADSLDPRLENTVPELFWIL